MSFTFVNFHSVRPNQAQECSVCQEACTTNLLGRKVVAHINDPNITHCFHSCCLKEWVNAREGQANCPVCNVAIIIERRTRLRDRFYGGFRNVNLLQLHVLARGFSIPVGFMGIPSTQR